LLLTVASLPPNGAASALIVALLDGTGRLWHHEGMVADDARAN